MAEILIIMWMAWLLTTDVIYAARGQMPPRKQVRLAQIQAGTAQQRYGVRGWFADLKDDALRAHTEHRRAKAAAQRADGVEVVREQPAAAPVAAVPSQHGPGPAAAAERSPGVVHTDDHTYCLQPGCAVCGRDKPRWGWSCRLCGHREGGFGSEDAAVAASNAHSCPQRAAAAQPQPAPAPTPQPVPDPQGPQPQPAPQPRPAPPPQPQPAPQPAPQPGPDETPTGPAAGDDSNGPIAPVIPMFPTDPPGSTDSKEEPPMSQTTTDQPVAEVTGLQSAITYADGVAQAHTAHGSAEGFASSLAEAEYGDGVLQAVAAAQEASMNAGALWTEAADKLREALVVAEAYKQVPDAGNKAHVTAE